MMESKTNVVALLLCCFVTYSIALTVPRPISMTPSLLPTEDCGNTESDNRITMGNRTNLLEYPWQTALKYKSSRAYECGGSLINRRYVLTAAHCITPDLIGVRLGEYDFQTSVDCEINTNFSKCSFKPQDFNVTKKDVTIHKEYKDVTKGFDIALIRLPKEAVYNAGVRPVCLPITESLTPKNLTKVDLSVTGWGLTEYGQPSPVLLKSPVLYEENSVCMKQTTEQLLDSQFCTKPADNGACNGDSGGPITTFINDNNVVKAVQIGLVSYGPKRCGKSMPRVYTRLSSYTQWITDNVKP